jgi:gas vesicle protein
MSTNKLILGLVTGAAVGVVAMLLLAPASGPETRRQIVKGVKKLGNKASNKFQGLAHANSEIMKNVRQSVEEKLTSAGFGSPRSNGNGAV